jgi:hypothetical protein
MIFTNYASAKLLNVKFESVLLVALYAHFCCVTIISTFIPLVLLHTQLRTDGFISKYRKHFHGYTYNERKLTHLHKHYFLCRSQLACFHSLSSTLMADAPAYPALPLHPQPPPPYQPPQQIIIMVQLSYTPIILQYHL